jgi:hypothetical protein
MTTSKKKIYCLILLSKIVPYNLLDLRLVPVAMSQSHKLITLASINNTQYSIEQARGRSYEEGSSQIFMLDDMQLGFF